jgi:tagaturonate reductase
MQYSSKVRSRDVPVLLRHFELHQEPPPYFSLGFAAYLLFMRAVWNRQDTYYGEFRGQPYIINDDKAAYYYDLWRQYPPAEVATLSLKNKDLWGADLSLLPGFEGTVRLNLDDLINKGPAATLARLTSKMSTL